VTDDPRDRRPIPARRLSVVKRTARALTDAGITPNQISIFGLGAALASGLCLALTSYFRFSADFLARALFLASAFLIVLRGLSNMFDGMVAVEQGRGTPTGALYNEVPDRFSDVAIFVGAGYAVGSATELGYAAALTALLVAFVRVAARAAGAPSDFGGLMAKQQRMFSVAAVAAYLALAPEAWRPGFGPERSLGLVGLVLLLIVLGGIPTIIGRLRRATRWLERHEPI